MKKYIVIFWLLLPFLGLAQQPQWTDYSWRTSNYPDQDFFMAFESGAVPKGKNTKDLLDEYEAQAKAALIQQIQVNVQATTDYHLTNVDDATTEAFKMSIQTLSKAQITGLRSESYHDSKKDLVYAIAFAKKSELKYFYKNVVSRLMEQIQNQKQAADNYRSKNSQQQALKTYYEIMPLFTELEDAQFVLIALELVNELDTRLKESLSLSLDVKNAITDLQQSDKSSIDDLGYFMAYGLFLQLGELSVPIFLDEFAFENSGLTAEFSTRFREAVSSGLVRSGNYRVLENASKTADMQLSGSYWKEGEQLKVSAVARQNGQAKAAAEISLPIQWLRDKSINWVPENYQRIAKLAEISLEAMNPQQEARAGRPLEPLKVKVFAGAEALIEVPLLFSMQDENLGKANTNQAGIAILPYTPKQADRQMQIVLANIDLIEFIGGNPAPAFLKQLEKQYPVAPARFMIKVAPLTIYVQSIEKEHYGNQLEINLLEPALKEALASRGYVFTDQINEADLLVEIDAKSRNGSNTQGIYFAFVDANVSVMDLSDGREIWKQNLSSIKGGGADFRRATVKAFETVAEQLKKTMPDKME